MIFGLAQGAVAQLGERCVRNAEVGGSIPLGSILTGNDKRSLLLSFTTLPKIPGDMLIIEGWSAVAPIMLRLSAC